VNDTAKVNDTARVIDTTKVNLQKNVVDTRSLPEKTQMLIDGDPLNVDLHAREAVLIASLQEASLDEERFVK